MHVHTRTKSKADPILQMGAKYFDTPMDVAKESDVLFTMVGFPNDLIQVALDETRGALNHLKPGSILVDFTTSRPSLAKEIAEKAKSKSIYSLDCPVSGGDVGAKNGTLVVFAGGEKEALDAVTPLLQCFSQRITHFGGPGQGQQAKMANQIVICSTMIGVCEGLLYARKAGLDLDDFLSTISLGAASSFSVSKLAPRIVKGDYAPGFYVEHFVKDLSICMEEARMMNLRLPGLQLALSLYEELIADGDGRLGTQALIRALERKNQVSLFPSSLDG
eukprot:CAMPEP_0184700706 /NCGR_PEP_ID=MMETSP0313-20130426/15489_1 /TAXON_ID=2792 /ORGANISM="Porphyridium aerugineum, Strain SAG 1380-2" /LENGTH=275 /DNA_ID=CAMNT_0027160503 /DNA_START=210 /DNA_END=1037 /DNA_ORIENTATION=+